MGAGAGLGEISEDDEQRAPTAWARARDLPTATSHPQASYPASPIDILPPSAGGAGPGPYRTDPSARWIGEREARERWDAAPWRSRFGGPADFGERGDYLRAQPGRWRAREREQGGQYWTPDDGYFADPREWERPRRARDFYGGDDADENAYAARLERWRALTRAGPPPRWHERERSRSVERDFRGPRGAGGPWLVREEGHPGAPLVGPAYGGPYEAQLQRVDRAAMEQARGFARDETRAPARWEPNEWGSGAGARVPAGAAAAAEAGGTGYPRVDIPAHRPASWTTVLQQGTWRDGGARVGGSEPPGVASRGGPARDVEAAPRPGSAAEQLCNVREQLDALGAGRVAQAIKDGVGAAWVEVERQADAPDVPEPLQHLAACALMWRGGTLAIPTIVDSFDPRHGTSRDYNSVTLAKIASAVALLCTVASTVKTLLRERQVPREPRRAWEQIQRWAIERSEGTGLAANDTLREGKASTLIRWLVNRVTTTMPGAWTPDSGIESGPDKLVDLPGDALRWVREDNKTAGK